MKVTTYLLKEFIDIEHLEIEAICNALNVIGLEVEVSTPMVVPKKIVVGKVLQKEAHPDADKLSVCKVDVGHEVLQIVCGAKNVAQDQFVAVALNGARLEFDEKILEIKPSKLRGVESFGMLCSSVELGLPKINDGIMLLDESIGELVLGKELREYEIFNTHLLEISLTPNRGDCLCVLGIAREIKTYFALQLKKAKEYMSTNQFGIGRKFQVSQKNKVDSSLLYKVVDFEQRTLPLKMQIALGIGGILKTGIIENYTGYVSYMTGVVLNAYEADRLYKNQNPTSEILWLYVQKNQKGFEEVFANEVLSNIGVGNLIEQNLDASKTIIFEASYINPAQISQVLFDNKDCKQNKELTYKSARGTNPNLHLGINYLCLLLDAYNSCFIYDGVQEIKQDREENVIRTKFSSIAQIIGFEIPIEMVSDILKQLDFYLELKTNDNSFSVVVPSYRHDIQTEQDLAEEILRIYGVDKIPALPHKMQEKPKNTPAYLDYKNQRDLIKRALSNNFVECIHYLFYQRERLQKFGFEVLDLQKDLLNPITSELNTLRTSLIPALLDSILRNQNFGYKNIRLCEIGSVYDSNRTENTKVAFVVSGLKEKEQFPNPKGIKWDFYSFAQVVANIVGNFELQKYDGNTPNILHPHQSAWVYIKNQKAGFIAKLHPSIAREMDLQNVFLCELDLQKLALEHPICKPFSKLPTSLRDLTLIIDDTLAFFEIKQAILQANIKYLKNVYPLDIFTQDDGKIALSIRAEITPEDITLTEEDITKTMQKILEVLEQKFKIKLKN
ncbi:phenylalanine--tRNA ligase subunit beta [Helicobacter anseris]|uniref:Phenylalanine--tRNA ligase beta subunit n=1 Tax=Helicobacter anseris TaxID=375926 RepID=A0A3D8J7K9_9HELI|nr:phenylalanine--tRNA ligase subunit beta [Helicobacter anseris]RDU73260.1 phenylalanine--tRNA ligase subunit beta [Helicobacter anseris]